MAWWGQDVEGVSLDSAIVGEALNLNGAWLFAMGNWSLDCSVLKSQWAQSVTNVLGQAVALVLFQ